MKKNILLGLLVGSSIWGAFVLGHTMAYRNVKKVLTGGLNTLEKVMKEVSEESKDEGQ